MSVGIRKHPCTRHQKAAIQFPFSPIATAPETSSICPYPMPMMELKCAFDEQITDVCNRLSISSTFAAQISSATVPRERGQSPKIPRHPLILQKYRLVISRNMTRQIVCYGIMVLYLGLEKMKSIPRRFPLLSTANARLSEIPTLHNPPFKSIRSGCL